MTVEEFIKKLKSIPKQVEVEVGYGENTYPLKFIITNGKTVILHPNVYKANPTEEYINTVITLNS